MLRCGLGLFKHTYRCFACSAQISVTPDKLTMFTRAHRNCVNSTVNSPHISGQTDAFRFSRVNRRFPPRWHFFFYCQPSPCSSLNCRLEPTHRHGRMHASALAECDRPCSTCSTGKSPAQVCCLLPLRHEGETARSPELDALSDSTRGPGGRLGRPNSYSPVGR